MFNRAYGTPFFGVRESGLMPMRGRTGAIGSLRAAMRKIPPGSCRRGGVGPANPFVRRCGVRSLQSASHHLQVRLTHDFQKNEMISKVGLKALSAIDHKRETP